MKMHHELSMFNKLPSAQIRINAFKSISSKRAQQKQLCSIFFQHGEGLELDKAIQQMINPKQERQRLLGGGCGVSTDSVQEVEKKVDKQKEKTKKKPNFKIDADFLEEYEKLTNRSRILENMGIKSSDKNDDNETEGEINLMEEVMKLEDCASNFTRCLGDSIFRYQYYYQRIFELMLQYQFLSIDQQYGERSSFREEQKQKLISIRDVCIKQKNKQPALNLIFYLDLFIKMKETNVPNSKEFTDVVQSVKNASFKVVSKSANSINICQVNVVEGIKEITSLATDLVGLIEEAKAKKLYKMLISIQLERIQSKQSSSYLEEEILYYTDKLNSLIETGNDETKEDLIIYYILRINFILQKRIIDGNIASDSIQENPEKGKREKANVNKQSGSKDKKNDQKSSITPSNHSILKLINNLIVECQNDTFSDSLKDFVKLNVSNYSLRFASLSLQINLRIHFQNMKLCATETYKILLINIFKRYLYEDQPSIKVLLYYDFNFQEMINARKTKKKDDKKASNKESRVADSKEIEKEENKDENTIGGVQIDDKFYQEYLEYDKSLKTRITRLAHGELNNETNKVDDVDQAVEDNMNAGKDIVANIN